MRQMIMRYRILVLEMVSTVKCTHVQRNTTVSTIPLLLFLILNNGISISLILTGILHENLSNSLIYYEPFRIYIFVCSIQMFVLSCECFFLLFSILLCNMFLYSRSAYQCIFTGLSLFFFFFVEFLFYIRSQCACFSMAI